MKEAQEKQAMNERLNTQEKMLDELKRELELYKSSQPGKTTDKEGDDTTDKEGDDTTDKEGAVNDDQEMAGNDDQEMAGNDDQEMAGNDDQEMADDPGEQVIVPAPSEPVPGPSRFMVEATKQPEQEEEEKGEEESEEGQLDKTLDRTIVFPDGFLDDIDRVEFLYENWCELTKIVQFFKDK